MCTMVVIDTSVFSKILPRNREQSDSEVRALLPWIRGRHGIVAYEETSVYRDELRKNPRIWALFREYRRGQQAKLIGPPALEEAKERLQNATIRSDDRHILVLALASNALVLCSNDRDLRKDFLDIELLPKISRQPRAVYPIGQPRKEQNEFLNGRKCPHRAVT